MILPSKHIGPDRALLTIGAEILANLDRPHSVSVVWDKIRARGGDHSRISYDWFLLALDLLFALGAVEYQSGALSRARP
jgi:hypothetical protein